MASIATTKKETLHIKTLCLSTNTSYLYLPWQWKHLLVTITARITPCQAPGDGPCDLQEQRAAEGGALRWGCWPWLIKIVHRFAKNKYGEPPKFDVKSSNHHCSPWNRSINWRHNMAKQFSHTTHIIILVQSHYHNSYIDSMVITCQQDHLM